MATMSHPVESVSWLDCESVLPRFGLVLPTELQWEYAARAHTQTPWWTGAEVDSLSEGGVAAENIWDHVPERDGEGRYELLEPPNIDDGAPIHAAVGSFQPNPFGLYDVLGNVSEICRDGYHDSWYWWPESRLKDAYREEGSKRVGRGGSFSSSPDTAAVARRIPIDPEGAVYSRGVRPARSIERR